MTFFATALGVTAWWAFDAFLPAVGTAVRGEGTRALGGGGGFLEGIFGST